MRMEGTDWQVVGALLVDSCLRLGGCSNSPPEILQSDWEDVFTDQHQVWTAFGSSTQEVRFLFVGQDSRVEQLGWVDI